VTPERIAQLRVRRVLQRLGEEYGEDRIEDLRGLWKQIESELGGLLKELADAR
jgi:hypothetical protein